MKSSKNNQAPRTALAQLPFGAIQLQGAQGDQFHATQRFLLELSTDTMLKPYRELAGLPAPGNDIGGWYDNFPTKWFGRGFAPGPTNADDVVALATPPGGRQSSFDRPLSFSTGSGSFFTDRKKIPDTAHRHASTDTAAGTRHDAA
jgi:hypothetical protein